MHLSLLPFWALLFLQTDPRLDQALAAIARAAAQLLETAPRFGSQETLKQKAIVTPRRTPAADPGNRAGPAQAPDRTNDRQILSAYALCGRGPHPQSLQEIRVVYESQGKTILPRAKAWAELKEAALTNFALRPELRGEFERESLGETAVDFGQLLLLFQKTSLPKYTFALLKSELVGADAALVISFAQQSGAASLHLNEAGKRSQARLEGQIWVRATDYLPLRIILRAERDRKKVRLRDEVHVDYELHQGATLLPASVSHRRYLDDQLRAENIYQYAEWLALDESQK